MSRGLHSSRVQPSQSPQRLVDPDSVLGLASTSAVEFFRDRALLFSEHDQRISRLEGASALLAPLLERGATFGELTQALMNHGAEAGAAQDWVTSLIQQLARLSLLEAKKVRDRAAVARQPLQLGSLCMALSYSTDQLRDRIAPVFAHLETDKAFHDASLRIADFGMGLVQIGEDDGPAILVPRDEAAVRIKGMLLESMFAATGDYAALHAALLSDGDTGVLLLGSPGSGKSTLALALLSKGYRYGSDDVTLLNRDGTLSGISLAPGVKEAGWAIAEEFGAALTPLPAHMRPDGQAVRFVKIDRDILAGAVPARAIVVLHRSPGSIGELRAMSSEEALAELLRESRANGGRCTVETMSALASLVRGAACFHLHYAEAMDAADLIASIRPS